VGFGRNTLEWLGVTGNNSEWGKGVRLAMLDTGVGEHGTLGKRVRQIDLITGDGPPIALHGHGTAVAALMIGDDGVSQGIIPGANLLSIRIADESGGSNTFLLAEGIVRAVDEGAQIINISMGSYGDSPLVQDAVAYAGEKQVLIVAAAGNEGFSTPSYPAAYEGVIAVGAVDAAGQHLAFSNTGDAIDVSAPGFDIMSAWPGEEYTSFSGTSAAAPLVTGALGATMTETQSGVLLPQQALTILENNMNAAGAPGDDPFYGGGNLDVDRMVNTRTAGRFDLAVASNWYKPPTGEEVVGTLQVTVQNQGTEAMAGTTVDVIIHDDIFTTTLPRLQGGASHVVSLPINEPAQGELIAIRSTINLNGNEDRDPSNNVLAGNVGLVDGSPGTTQENSGVGNRGPESD
ncbi:MAG: S8 family serine peptidase, partial [Roseibacillus sp.]|nr:S8 family serine peptidase [Roseibacillus sp.]